MFNSSATVLCIS